MITANNILPLTPNKVLELTSSVLGVAGLDSGTSIKEIDSLLEELYVLNLDHRQKCSFLTQKIYSIEIEQKLKELNSSMKRFLHFLDEKNQGSSQKEKDSLQKIHSAIEHAERDGSLDRHQVISKIISNLESEGVPLALYQVSATGFFVDMKRTYNEYMKILDQANTTIKNIQSPELQTGIKQIKELLTQLLTSLRAYQRVEQDDSPQGVVVQTKINDLIAIFTNELIQDTPQYHITPIRAGVLEGGY